MALDDAGYDLTAQLLGLNQQDDPQPFSNYWLHMDGKGLETAVVDRARRFRESQSADGLLRGYRLKTAYVFNEYCAALGLSALRGDA
jgi:hypothetical protein